LSISPVWLVDSLMQALAAVLHGASVDCGGGGGFGVVVFVVGLGVVVFGVVVLVDVEELVELLGAATGDDVVTVGVVVVVVGDSTEEFCEPAARTGSGCGEPQALSTAVAATAAPMISLRTSIPVSLSCVIPVPLKTVRYSPGLRCVRSRQDLSPVTSPDG
jgi:hypothetical protein